MTVEVYPNAKHLERHKDTKFVCPDCGSEDIIIGGRTNFEWWEDFIECRKCRKSSGTNSCRRFDEIVEKWIKEQDK